MTLTECSCIEDSAEPCAAIDHDCICDSDGIDPLCRQHGHEDVTSGCFDDNPERRAQILRALVP